MWGQRGSKKAEGAEKATEEKRNFLLMGKTGEGKSATGNTLLGFKFFKASPSSRSVTKEVTYTAARFEHYLLHVVDGPGLLDTDLNQIKRDKNADTSSLHAKESAQRAVDAEVVISNIYKALAMCYGGVHAILLVIRFGTRFTKENVEALKSLKTIFGTKYMDHVVVIMTHGDQFLQYLEDEEIEDKSFHSWCRAQDGTLKDLYHTCQGRFVLFNNIEKDENKKRIQVLELMKMVDGIKSRYDADCFKQADEARRRMIVEFKAPQLKLEIQEKIGILTGEIAKLEQNGALSETNKAEIKKRILILKNEIMKEDQNFGVFKDILELIEDMLKNLNNRTELSKLNSLLESKRASAAAWNLMRTLVSLHPFLALPFLIDIPDDFVRLTLSSEESDKEK